MGATGKVSNVDSLLGFLKQFANAVVISEKEPQLLWVWQPRLPGERLPEENGENHQEGMFKLERGNGEEGEPILSKVGGYTRGHPG